MLFVSSSLQLNLVSKNTKKKTRGKREKELTHGPRDVAADGGSQIIDRKILVTYSFFVTKGSFSSTITAIFADLHIIMMKNCLYPVSR